MLSDGCSGTGAASRIDHQVTRIGCHQNTPFDQLWTCLNHVDLFYSEATYPSISPLVGDRRDRIIHQKTDITNALAHCQESARFAQPLPTLRAMSPEPAFGR